MSLKDAIIQLLPIMLYGMMGFLMAYGLSRMRNHWGFSYKQLPALKQSLAKVVSVLPLGATRYQAFSDFKAKIVLGIFCSSFFLISASSAMAANPVTPVVNQVKKVTQDATNAAVSALPSISPKPSIYPAATQPSPSTAPAERPSANFQLPHPGYVTTPFSSYHPGIDICIGLGMPIHPIAKGVVTEAGYNFWGLGLMVEVDHGNGYKSVYGHMGKIYVNKGQEVNADELLGEVGMTGHTTGPHTHLELSYNGQKIDPRPLLPELRNYPTADDFVVHESSSSSTVAIPTDSTTANVQPSSSYKPEPTPDPEEVKKANEEKLTSEKISEDNLTTFLSQTKPEDITTLPINLTDSLPKTSSNIVAINQTNELNNILSKPVTVKNTDTKTKFEELAQKNLSSLLARSNPQPSATPLPEGGRISLNIFGFLK